MNGRSHWYTGGWTRMCECGTRNADESIVWPPGEMLRVYTDGYLSYAHCAICNKTWRMDTLKEVEK